MKFKPLSARNPKHPTGRCYFRTPVCRTLSNIYHYPIPYVGTSFPGFRLPLMVHPALVSLMKSPVLGTRHARARIYNRLDHLHRYNCAVLVRRHARRRRDYFSDYLSLKNKALADEALFCSQNKTQSVYQFVGVGEGAQ